MIRAGEVGEIHKASGDWVFTDIGFSSSKPTCGFLAAGEEACAVHFSELVARMTKLARKSGPTLNLLIEAPLSVAFTSAGNPTHRSIEKRAGESRCWYFGLGCGVMVASLYLIKSIADHCPLREIRLFEGFASFKRREHRRTHTDEVRNFHQIVWEPQKYMQSIVAPNALWADQHDNVISAFKVAGMDFGVPPVIVLYELRDPQAINSSSPNNRAT